MWVYRSDCVVSWWYAGKDAKSADVAAARVLKHLDAAKKNIDVNVAYVQHAISRVKRRLSQNRRSLTLSSHWQHDIISKKDFMKYFDDELAARIEMRDISTVQERIKRVDFEADYDVDFDEVTQPSLTQTFINALTCVSHVSRRWVTG